MNVMNTKIFERENAKLAPASFITGHQKVVMKKVRSSAAKGMIAIAAVACLKSYKEVIQKK
jgi:hypothetical protein